MADLEQATEYLAADLQNGEYFDLVEVQSPGSIFANLESDDGPDQHFEIKIEEF